jgi:tetratricopeptide (TPR) repeat protein
MLQKSFDANSPEELNTVIELQKYLVEKYRKADDHERLVILLNRFSEFLIGRDGYFTQGIGMAQEAEKISQLHHDLAGEQKAIGNQTGLLASTIIKYRATYLSASYGLSQPSPEFPMDLDVDGMAVYALDLALKREAICAQIHDSLGSQESFGFRAFLLCGLGYFHQAMQLYTEQYKIAELADNPEVMAQSHRNMAEIHAKCRNIDSALASIKKAFAIARKYSLRTTEDMILHSLELLVKIPRLDSDFHEIDLLKENELDWFGMQETRLAEVLDHFNDPNIRDKHGRTVLMAGAEKGSLFLVTEMMKRFSDINARDERDQTALSIAKSKNHQQIVLVLSEKGAKE